MALLCFAAENSNMNQNNISNNNEIIVTGDSFSVVSKNIISKKIMILVLVDFCQTK